MRPRSTANTTVCAPTAPASTRWGSAGSTVSTSPSAGSAAVPVSGKYTTGAGAR